MKGGPLSVRREVGKGESSEAACKSHSKAGSSTALRHGAAWALARVPQPQRRASHSTAARGACADSLGESPVYSQQATVKARLRSRNCHLRRHRAHAPINAALRPPCHAHACAARQHARVAPMCAQQLLSRRPRVRHPFVGGILPSQPRAAFTRTSAARASTRVSGTGTPSQRWGSRWRPCRAPAVGSKCSTCGAVWWRNTGTTKCNTKLWQATRLGRH